ncbi:MAG: RlmE family RNA methyltransferase [Spirochaetaceae bacterium]|jgi:23S rRNA (uridine2552-2'-O)-methyltransferase|nr:RlmE family RNA methyltransferase [Spirochaetaceae bacterium]
MASYEKPDFWALKAQKEGYPARSVYKLKEIDDKYHLFKPGTSRLVPGLPEPGIRILELGAAPGSWSLYVLRLYAKTGKPAALPGGRSGSAENAILLAAADLLPLSRRFDGGLFDRKDFFFIQGDFTESAVKGELTRRGPYTTIISDAAPATTGIRTVDTLRSLALAEEVVLSYAEKSLAPGGNLALKVFQGADTAALLKRLREQFNNVKSFKPVACRSDSFETYYIGLGKR